MGLISSKPKQNLIINGNMQLSQRFGTSSIASIASSVYPVDRFQYVKSGAMVHNAQQIADAPTDSQSGYQYVNSLNLNLTTPDTSIAAGDLCLIQQKIEGYIFTQIARQKTFTLSFWIRATAIGTYCVAFQNSGSDRSYVAEYTVNTTNTWEYKTITVNTPTPTAGTWNYTNGVGLNVVWTIAAGTTYQTTAGSWNTGNFIATSNQVNGVNTGATDWRITGVMLHEGSGAQAFKSFGNTFEEEVAAAQRYYEKSYNLDIVPGTVNDLGAIIYSKHTTTAAQPMFQPRFKVTKRGTPSVQTYDPVNGASGSYRDGNGNPVACTPARIGTQGFFVLGNSSTTQPSANSENSIHWTADAEL